MSSCPGYTANAHRRPASAHRQRTNGRAGNSHPACASRNRYSIAGAYAYRAAAHSLSIASGYRYGSAGLTHARIRADTYG